MTIIAIDLGKFNSMACVYNHQTQETQFESLSTERGFFKTLLNSYSADLVVAEACGTSGWVSDLRGEMEIRMLGCSTQEDALLRTQRVAMNYQTAGPTKKCFGSICIRKERYTIPPKT